jgi:hypothetical protein
LLSLSEKVTWSLQEYLCGEKLSAVSESGKRGARESSTAH